MSPDRTPSQSRSPGSRAPFPLLEHPACLALRKGLEIARDGVISGEWPSPLSTKASLLNLRGILATESTPVWRYASHITLVLLILLVLLAWESNLMVAHRWQILSAPAMRADRADYTPGLSSRRSGGFLQLVSAPVAVASEQEKRIEIVTYTVQPGDTVYDIARRFGISGETILWSNPELEKIPDLLSVGEELTILPVSGVYHIVEPDDTVESLAEKYKVDPSSITDFELNNLKEPYQLTIGQKLVIPGGEKPFVPLRRFVAAYSGPIPEDASKGTGSFGWPVSGRITQQFWSGHPAIDIGASTGTPVYASDSGFVIVAGWSDVGYGYTMVIDHGNGFQTRYAHLSRYYPDAGQSVAKGEQIGEVGSTGRSTGPHLHFGIIENGVRRNPFGFLP